MWYELYHSRDMTTKHMKSREVRDNWRDVLDHVRSGGTVVVEHYNKPVARIVPIEEPIMTTSEHFTAWLTTDSSCLDQGCADVVVLRDELQGEPDDRNAWTSTGDPLMHAVTTVDAKDGDAVDAIREAGELLEAHGWERDGDWEAVPTGYIATVARN